MTPIADMVEQMLADGVSSAVILLAVRTIEAVTFASRDASRFVTLPSRTPAAIRAARYRENIKLNKVEAEANDTATTVKPERDASVTTVTPAPTLLPSLSLNLEGSIEEGSSVSKKARSENARARGQRMLAGAILTDEWRQAAIELGAELSQIDEMWAEHVDYWVGVPGQRGVKLDWLATWRNDIRRKLKLGKSNGRARQQSLGDLARDLAEQARSAERKAGVIRSDEPVRGH